MNIPAERWYQAVFQRHSRRQFNKKALPENIVNDLLLIQEELNGHLPGSRIVFKNQDPDAIFSGAIGSYGKIKDAPTYAAFIGDMRDPNVQEKVGYLGECFILEATAMGLATCWVGGFFRPEIVAEQIKIESYEKVLSVTPVGFTDSSYSLTEKMMSGMVGSKKRKPLTELYVSEAEYPVWVQSALEAGRLAPSAVNRQPWRFFIENNSIKVTTDAEKGIADKSNISKRLDCGIAMAHIEIAALKNGVIGQWQYLLNPDVAIFKAK
ncbi:MAG: nitroreductase [Gracilibacter sp. BRH_c7a]|nr:MAG: nitroreductase [Gracilibacter sp. BRH_c7a]